MTSNDNFDIDPDGSQPALRAMRQCKVPLPEDLPITVFAARDDITLEDLPEFFVGGSVCAFTKSIAAPLRKFDLGKTLLMPVRILLADKQTEVYADRQYVAINRFEVFESFDIDASRNLRPSLHKRDPPKWRLPSKLKDDDIAISASTPDVPPIWGDKILMGGIYFRGDVVEALEAAGVAKFWNFKSCRIVD
jgi:hypothetical protein